MRIEITQPSKALTPFVWKDVPKLAVIIGPNGAGKSQLLHAIASSFRANDRRRRAGTPSPVVVSEFAAEPHEVVLRISEWSVQNPGGRQATWLAARREELRQKLGQRGPFEHDADARLLAAQEKRLGLDRGQLTTAHVDEIPDEDLLQAEPGSTEALVEAFTLWWIKNIEAQLAAGIAPEPPAPWDAFNELLRVSGIAYQVTPPPKGIRLAYECKFVHRETNVPVAADEMSSGERVLLTLFMTIFSAETNGRMPRLLLLDEPDAHLHPEMARRFLRAVREVLVEKHDVRVMLTTHSPTTVAMCPEGAIFAMLPLERNDGPRVRPVSVDEALGVLCRGVPTLRVRLENRRQVFVESEFDQTVYELVAECLAEHIDPELSMMFIPSAKSRDPNSGGCDRVRALVETLRNAGVDSVFGLVDWDLKAKPSGTIRVLGEGRRYAIENYVCDPLLLVAYLLREHMIAAEDVGLSKIGTYKAVVAKDAMIRQRLVDFVTDRVLQTLQGKSLPSEHDGCESVDGVAVQVPRWYLRMRGHDLVLKLWEAFPKLQKHQNDIDLAKAILKRVGLEDPGLLPVDLLRLLQDLQSRA